MSRLTIVASLVLAMSALASADRAFVPEPQPQHKFAEAPGEPAPSIRMMPRRPLDRDTVRAALVRARAANLAAFRAYQKKGVFPSNTFADGKLNVWRDANGHLCAAATIIDNSGQHDLVARVAEQDNFIRLADVTQGPLMSWILTSGFTQDEIAAIQEPFVGVSPDPGTEDPRIVDARMRSAEDARLRAKYAAVEKMLIANQKKSIELAVDRLMKHSQLAWQLVES
jgi:hypothetical protein